MRVEASGAGDPQAAYATEGLFAIEVPDGRQTRVQITVDETGDGPQALAKKKQGTFDVRIKAAVKTTELEK